MAQSRMVAKNTFGEGLIMDFAPNNTLASVLTNALNATLLTYNGNEMSLLNDMGNGRVETAFLPEGYAPVGTCEFGGIIYIVSYNPNDDKCLIGCFPSPERNIMRDEESDLQNSTLSATEFLEFENNQPTGKLKNLVTKVIIREKDTNPGDKYIISQVREFTENDIEAFTGLRPYSPDGTLEDSKGKRIKLSIVSIEESGKITKLDTQTYNIKVGSLKAAYIISDNFLPDSGINKKDIDAYRSMVSLLYNVFSSRVPGKLAILAELETITTFSCGHSVKTRTINDDSQIRYDVYLDYYWETEDPTVNPTYIVLTDSLWELTTGSVKLGNLEIGFSLQNSNLCEVGPKSTVIKLPNLTEKDKNGKVISNYFYTKPRNNASNNLDYSGCYYKGSKFEDGQRILYLTRKSDEFTYEVPVGTELNEIGEVQVNNKLGLSNLIYLFTIITPRTINESDILFKIPNKFTYTITPAMSYGLLDYLSVTNTIDFSLIGSKIVEPCGFKYFATNDFITINLDSIIYEEENHKVDKIVLEFYDHAGFAGSYTINNRESYAGESVITIPFNDYSLSTLDKEGNLYHHDFLSLIKEDLSSISPEIIRAANDTRDYKSLEECGDCGVLRKNALYGVKINYHYIELDAITQKPLIGLDGWEQWLTTPVWMYTNGQFNDYYYSTPDFTILLPAVPVLFTYKLTDKTNISNVHIDDNTRKTLTSLGNPTAVVLNKLNNDLNPMKTYASYNGHIDVEVQMGTSLDSIFNLINMDKNSDLKINLQLINPYYNVGSKNKEFEIIEQRERKDNNLEELEENEISIYNTYKRKESDKVYLENQTENGVSLKMDSTYKVNAKLLVDLKEVPFIYTPTNYKSELKEVTVLTPVLYDGNDEEESPGKCLNFNYDEIGGTDKYFKSALCFQSSDDLTDNETAWYSVTIDDDGGSSESFLKDYGSTAYTTPTNGDEALSRYYDSLGNRQPFSLFTVLPLHMKGTEYIKKWTHNIGGRGNCLLDPKDTFEEMNTDAYIVPQTSTRNSMFVPYPNGRSYIPMFITTRNAYGSGDVYMCSGGGNKKYASNITGFNKYWKGDKNTQVLPYTSHTIEEMKSRFWPLYLNTMKELITVNPEYSTCELGTFDFNEENCANLSVATYLMGSVLNLPEGKEVGEHVAILGGKYNLYIDNVIAQMLETNKKFINSNNRNIGFDDSLVGKLNGKILIAPINIILAHEHEEILNYSNFKGVKVLKYLNYVNNNYENLKHNYNYITTERIDSTKFYHADLDDLDSIRIKELDNTNFETNYDGHIKCISGINGKWWENSYKFSPRNNTLSKATSLKYTLLGNPIFYNTTMTIYDFIWDVNNSLHYFLFTNDSVLKLVDANFSYLLDDDGNHDANIVAVPYRIGPSFTHSW